ncbi:MAG: iron-containing alcohol dehydrogenase [Planctomycetota bacterium]
MAQLSDLTAEYNKILIIYGGGSIKRNGVYDQVKSALKNKTCFEFAGIEPNPQLETCLKAAELAKKEKVDFLLAVGGGSVLDATKFIAAAIQYEGSDPWEIMTSHGEVVKSAMPFGTVLTLPATGSEMNFFSVISRKETEEKLAFGTTIVYPKFSILDPETTYTLSKKQIRNGIVDTFAHVMEQYATCDVDTPLQDRMAEAIVKTLIEKARDILEDEPDYNTRATFMWCATMALNGLIACGSEQDWSTHMIGHELTAFFGVDHAESLAIVMPGLWKHKKQQKNVKLAQLAERVFNVTEGDLDQKADACIQKTVDFFHSVGMPTRLSDFNIGGDGIKKIVERFKQRGTVLGEHEDVDAEQIELILNRCI